MINLEGLRAWGGLAGAPLEEAGVVVAGIAYDGSAVYRKGAAAAPSRVRQLSAVMPPVTESGRLLAGLRIHDLGDLNVTPDIEHGWRQVTDRLLEAPRDALLTVVGGDHCATIPILAAQARRHPGLAVAWIDAHPDLCDLSRGSHWTCGCALRRGLEAASIEARSAAIVGGRDFDPEEIDFIHANEMLLLTSERVAEDPAAAGRKVAEWAARRPLHLSFDIDFLDPAYAPGTEIPSAGGATTRQALTLLAAIAAESRLVGLDVAEVSPPADSADITSLAALKVIFEFWGRAWRPPTL